MGIFNSLLGKKKADNVRLITLVKKTDDSEHGVFVKIQNDIGAYIAEAGESENNLRKMAYAYARRASAAGLYLQGIWERKDYAYSFTMFKNFQQVTEQTTEFQNEAAQQAAELLKSYDSRLTLELISLMITMVESGDVPSPDMVVTDDFVFDILENVSSKL